MAPVEKPKKSSSAYNEAITTKLDLKETERNKACTHLIREKSYGLV